MPPPPGSAPQRRKSRRGSHDSKLADPLFFPVEFLHPSTDITGDVYDVDVLESLREDVAERSAAKEALVKTKSSKARRGSMAATIKKAVGDAAAGTADAVRRLSTSSTASQLTSPPAPGRGLADDAAVVP